MSSLLKGFTILLTLVAVLTLFPYEICTMHMEDPDRIAKEPRPGWVRFCSDDKHYDVFSNQCPAGFFWKPEFLVENNWDCVCTIGSWRRSDEWCSSEEVQRFTEGEKTCFTLENREMQGMLYLGDQYSAWDSGEPLLLTSYASGFTFRGSDFEEKFPIPNDLLKNKKNDPGVIVVRPKDDWTVEDRRNSNLRLCLRAPIAELNQSIDDIYIYNVSLLFQDSPSEVQLSFTRTCFTWMKGDGKVWFEVLGESLDDKDMILPKYNNETSDACRRCLLPTVTDPPTLDPYGNPLPPSQKRTPFDLKNVAALTSEINLQTARMGLYWTNRLFRNEADNIRDNYQEMELLQKAAVLAYGTCNMNYIPKEFYQYFLVMFKKLLYESFQKYAPVGPINTEYYQKILDLIDQCKNRTKPIHFEVEMDCSPKYAKYMRYRDTKGNNGSSFKPVPTPSDYSAEPAKHDYLLEFVWNLKSFLHYHCFPEFKQDSVLHDLLQNQLETLFTEDLILRWFNPSLAFRMYDHIFKTTLDLKHTMSNFEKCVRVVHEVNKFPVWLRRPIDQPHRLETPFFNRRRRKRSIMGGYSRQNRLQDAQVSMESEIADMALENIREKRTQGKSNEEEDIHADLEEIFDFDSPFDEDEDIQTSTTSSPYEEFPSLSRPVRHPEKIRNRDNEGKRPQGKINLGLSEISDVESMEELYRDSEELQSVAGGKALPTDKVWNKFFQGGSLGFAGSCVQSMSLFMKESKKNVENCW